MDSEVSIPTWYNQILLFIAGLLAAIIACVQKHEGGRKATHLWAILAASLIFLSIDEGASLHEPSTAIIQAQLLGVGVEVTRLSVWFTEGVIASAVFVLFFSNLWLSIPRRVRLLVLLAASTYACGVVGIEVVTAELLPQMADRDSFAYALWVALEEGLEMLGASLFIYAFLEYLSALRTRLQLNFS